MPAWSIPMGRRPHLAAERPVVADYPQQRFAGVGQSPIPHGEDEGRDEIRVPTVCEVLNRARLLTRIR
jgi:hypothetical protein